MQDAQLYLTHQDFKHFSFRGLHFLKNILANNYHWDHIPPTLDYMLCPTLGPHATPLRPHITHTGTTCPQYWNHIRPTLGHTPPHSGTYVSYTETNLLITKYLPHRWYPLKRMAKSVSYAGMLTSTARLHPTAVELVKSPTIKQWHTFISALRQCCY